MKPYKESAKSYLAKGWRPFPVAAKAGSIPTGITGDVPLGTVTEDKVAAWRKLRGTDNVALRMEGVIAIDVDHYGDKHGADTLAEYEARLGKLPPTFSCTARGQGQPSRQLYFQVGEDLEFVSRIGDDIEILQRRHRYAIVAPSVHPKLGTFYEWYGPDGEPCEAPEVIFLAELPGAWEAELTKEPTADLLTGVDAQPWRKLTDSFQDAPACLAVAVLMDDIEHESHFGHDEVMALTLRGFMLGREGHHGVPPVLDELYGRFDAYLTSTGDRARRGEAERLFADMGDLAQRKRLDVTACTCPVGTTLDELDDLDDGLDANALAAQAALLASPLTMASPRGKLDLDAAAARFVHEHPVMLHEGAEDATYVWTGDRWIATIRLDRYIYRWLNGALGSADFTPAKAKDLHGHVVAHAPSITDADLDARYISVENGLLDPQTRELRPRTKDIIVTTHLPVRWNPTAKPGRFTEWLRSAIEPAQHEAIWEILGYAIAPVHDLKVALALTGPGGGGKSTFVNMVQALVGRENCAAIPPVDLTKTFTRAELFGKTVNAAGDVGAEKIQNVGLWKSIVAADEIQAERKRRDPFRFRPRAFNVAAFNQLPETAASDSAFWDRWLVLGFQRRFNRSGVSDNFYRDTMPKVASILEGVLVGAVEGLNRLRERGGFDVDVFGDAKSEWRAQVDTVAAFVSDYCSVGDGEVNGKALYLTYTKAVMEAGAKPETKPAFFRQLIGYLDQVAPGRVHKRVSARNIVSFVGLRIVLDIASSEVTGDGSPASEYGRRGWTVGVG